MCNCDDTSIIICVFSVCSNYFIRLIIVCVTDCTVAMLTGDHDSVARGVADVLGIDECLSRLLPQEKLQWITNKQSESPRV
jgi:high-affinity K+ transport system ATPase subunit B